MNTYRKYTDRDEAVSRDGDRGFQGVEMRLEAGQLPPGMLASAVNCRFRNGKAATRKGFVKLNWTQRIGTTFPLVFPIDFAKTLPFVKVFGAGRFDDPDGQEWFYIAASVIDGEGGKVWVTRPNNRVRQEALPAGETISGPVSFCQAADLLFLFRGSDQAPLVLERPGGGFRALAAAEAGTGLSLIANAERGLWFQNRLIVTHGRDLVDVSDALDPEHVFAATNQFRINQGSSDRLTGVFKLDEGRVICSKESSLYLLSGLQPDAEGKFSGATLEAVTTSWGWIAPKSVAQVGGDLFGLSHLGVMSVRQTVENKLQGVDVPMSAPIEPLIARINWRHASAACGAYWDSKYYLAVPLDDAEQEGNNLVPEGLLYPAGGADFSLFGFEPGRTYRIYFGANESVISVPNGVSVTDYDAELGVATFTAGRPAGQTAYVQLFPTNEASAANPDGAPVTCRIVELFQGVNNAVLVYDFVTGAWAGSDQATGLTVADWVLLDYLGQERLFFVSADGFLNLYEEGFEDEIWQWVGHVAGLPDGTVLDVGVKTAQIRTELELRGYGMRALQQDGYSRADLGEVQARGLTLALETWNPRLTLYERPDGVAEERALATDKTRSRTRYERPFNAAAWDSSNSHDDFATAGREDYSVVPGEAGLSLGSGVAMDLHQAWLWRLRLRGRGSSVQVRLVNTQGRVEVKRMEVETQDGRRRSGAIV